MFAEMIGTDRSAQHDISFVIGRLRIELGGRSLVLRGSRVQLLHCLCIVRGEREMATFGSLLAHSVALGYTLTSVGPPTGSDQIKVDFARPFRDLMSQSEKRVSGFLVVFPAQAGGTVRSALECL
jgi:hypothetical protein